MTCNKAAADNCYQAGAVLRKFPAANEDGRMMMMSRGPAGGASGGQTRGRRAQARSWTRWRARWRHAHGRRWNEDAGLLERLPMIAIADVKAGDTIIVSSTRGADPRA